MRRQQLSVAPFLDRPGRDPKSFRHLLEDPGDHGIGVVFKQRVDFSDDPGRGAVAVAGARLERQGQRLRGAAVRPG